jgi:predicted ABC-class ATPase
MIRDERMRELISADREPITPFVDRVRVLFAKHGVSTILVAGGSGAFFDTADHILAMDAYRPRDVTAEAHRIAGREGIPNEEARGAFLNKTEPRVLGSRALSPRDKEKPARARGRTLIKFGDDVIDLAAVSQLVDPAQTEAVAFALDRIAEAASGRERPLVELVTVVLRCVDTHGLDWLSPFSGHPGHLARPRKSEILAALNRYRGSG